MSLCKLQPFYLCHNISTNYTQTITVGITEAEWMHGAEFYANFSPPPLPPPRNISGNYTHFVDLVIDRLKGLNGCIKTSLRVDPVLKKKKQRGSQKSCFPLYWAFFSRLE